MKMIFKAYAVIALLTFGYSYNVDWRPGNQVIAEEEINTGRAFIAATWWPVYWTVKAFGKLRPTNTEAREGR